MTCNGRDLTIDAVLTDPLIAAVMRADRVDRNQFERLLRSAARRIECARRAASAPAPAAFRPLGRAACLALHAW